jgi:hypothetical protein
MKNIPMCWRAALVFAATLTLSFPAAPEWWRNLQYKEQTWPSDRLRGIFLFTCHIAEKARTFADELTSSAFIWSDLDDNSFNCERLEAISGTYVRELDQATPGLILITDRQSSTFRVLPLQAPIH